jgi:diguanylate cyclase (GGDEF)-like protein
MEDKVVKKTENEQEENSLIDKVTQIANRRKFTEVLFQEWERAKRNGAILSVVILEVDLFNDYNDIYGNLQGNQCLTIIAQAIQQNLKRPADLVARWSEDEFACVLPETDLRGATFIGENLRKAIINIGIPHEISSYEKSATISVGVASMIPSRYNSIEEMLKLAEKALCSAKESGRNRVESEC